VADDAGRYPSSPHNWAAPRLSRNSPAVNPRCRFLIGPMCRSNIGANSNWSANSVSPANPEQPVNDGSGAPIRTRYRTGLTASTVATERVPLPG